MKIQNYLLALAPLALAGCVIEDPTPVATTTVTREVTTTTSPAVRHQVVVAQPPPAVRVETQTIAPGPGYVWTRGYWRWGGSNYGWVPGSWVSRPRVSAVWVDGHWVRRSDG